MKLKGMTPMSKKSVKSKGYRKTVVKKPYLTKKDIILAVSIFAAIILAVVLFNVFYHDGSLKVVNGTIITEGENSLIVNTGSASNPRYFKLGEAHAVEGYKLEATQSVYTDSLTTYNDYAYLSEDENNPIESVSLSTNPYSAKLISDATLAALSSTEGYECSEAKTAEYKGKTIHYYHYKQDLAATSAILADDAEVLGDAEALEAAAEEPMGYRQGMNAYVDVGNDRCLVYHLLNSTDTEEGYLTEIQLSSAMYEIIDALTFETR